MYRNCALDSAIDHNHNQLRKKKTSSHTVRAYHMFFACSATLKLINVLGELRGGEEFKLWLTEKPTTLNLYWGTRPSAASRGTFDASTKTLWKLFYSYFVYLSHYIIRQSSIMFAVPCSLTTRMEIISSTIKLNTLRGLQSMFRTWRFTSWNSPSKAVFAPSGPFQFISACYYTLKLFFFEFSWSKVVDRFNRKLYSLCSLWEFSINSLFTCSPIEH